MNLLKWFKKKETKNVFSFNDNPLNYMTWLRSNLIEATFNVGNPKEGDLITWEDRCYEIKHYEYHHNLHILLVEETK